jgi:hypothetical protein
MDNRDDFTVIRSEVGAGVVGILVVTDDVNVSEGKNEFNLPSDGTIDGTELTDGDCVGNRVDGCGVTVGICDDGVIVVRGDVVAGLTVLVS